MFHLTPQLAARRPGIRRVTVTVLIAAGLSGFIHANTTLDPVVVTATRTPTTIDAQTRDVSVLTAEAIAQSGAQSVADALRTISGIEVVTTGNAGATVGLFLRGTNSNHVLVLVDGQRIGSSTSGLTAVEAIAVASIERIEVVRGPHSALYGADALGGVVHIITKSAARQSAAVRFGTSATSHSSGQIGFGDTRWQAQISTSHDQSKGFNAITNPKNFSYNPDQDGFRRSGVVAQVRAEVAPKVRLSLRGLYNDLNTQYDGSSTFDDRALTTQTALSLGVEFGELQLRVASAQDRAKFLSEFPGTFITRTNEISAQLPFAISNEVNATVIAEMRQERIDTSDGFAVDSRRTAGVVGRLGGTLGGALWSAAVRADDSDQFGARVTGSAGVRFTIAPKVQVFANVGSAFKPPTFNDLYYPGFSNPNLNPERALGGDLGVRATVGGVNLSATAHQTRTTDLIVFQCNADFSVCAPQNVNRAQVRGVSLSANTALTTSTQLGLTFDVQSPKNLDTSLQLARRAKQHGSLNIQHKIGNATLRATVRASAARFDDAANAVRLPGFAKLDLGASYALTPQLTLEAQVRNVTDRAIETARDFATPGRETMIGVRWQP